MASIFDGSAPAVPTNSPRHPASREDSEGALQQAPSVSKVASIFESNCEEVSKKVEESPEKTAKERFADAAKIFEKSHR